MAQLLDILNAYKAATNSSEKEATQVATQTLDEPSSTVNQLFDALKNGSFLNAILGSITPENENKLRGIFAGIVNDSVTSFKTQFGSDQSSLDQARNQLNRQLFAPKTNKYSWAWFVTISLVIVVVSVGYLIWLKKK